MINFKTCLLFNKTFRAFVQRVVSKEDFDETFLENEQEGFVRFQIQDDKQGWVNKNGNQEGWVNKNGNQVGMLHDDCFNFGTFFIYDYGVFRDKTWDSNNWRYGVCNYIGFEFYFENAHKDDFRNKREKMIGDIKEKEEKLFGCSEKSMKRYIFDKFLLN